MAWEVEFTDQFSAWWDTLSVDEQEAVDAAVKLLTVRGPSLGRPVADTLRSSRHANMKVLRPKATSIRILFAFDPRRIAILSLGGDKRGQWREWYARAIPEADDLYDEYLAELRQEGLL